MKKQRRHSVKPQVARPIVQFNIQALSHEGRGIALYDASASEQQGKKVFVQYALPGEQVRAQITRQHKRFEEAEMVELLGEPSVHRATPFCPHYGLCGGCATQHIDENYQIEFKQDVLKSHLTHFAQVQPLEWLKPIQAESKYYRRRARMGVRWREKQQYIVVGFREQKSNYLIPIQDCQILDVRFHPVLTELPKLIKGLEQKIAITHIEFAAGDTELALILRCQQDLSATDLKQLQVFVKKHGWQLYLLTGNAETLQRIDENDAIMRLHYQLPEYNLKLAFSPLDFTQVNAVVNQQMVKLACDLLQLKHGERVLDLFCGLGNFSLPLARCVGETGRVVAVEGVAEMVVRGEENARANQISNIEFYAQDLFEDFSAQPWAKQGFDAILIDPPRAGAEQVMHFIARFSAKRIVYVSCDPATLARDTGILIRQGYKLVKAGVMDMFSHTAHVESIALFEQDYDVGCSDAQIK